jgi:hypothetical protein
MIITNGWRSKNKQSGKIIVKIRFGKCTIFDLYFDKVKRQAGFTLFNFGIKNGSPNMKGYDTNL